MENLDIILLSAVVSVLFLVFIIATYREFSVMGKSEFKGHILVSTRFANRSTWICHTLQVIERNPLAILQNLNVHDRMNFPKRAAGSRVTGVGTQLLRMFLVEH